MKKLLLVALTLSLPLAQAISAPNDDDQPRRKAKRHTTHAEAEAAAPARATAAPPARMQVRHRTMQRSPGMAMPPAQRGAVRSEASLNRGNNAKVRSVHPTTNRVINRNSFAVAKRNVIVVRHPRVWWVNRFPGARFVLWGGGYYYWWGGWWYPAPGYDPYYSAYTYSEPIYAPNNYAPGEMIENVQSALRDQGYYQGAVDGLVGPQTRDALASYQRDHGLPETAAIDQPTLATLGLA